jgi:hypothetical protein
VKYRRHFDREFRQRNCLGIEVMLDLHTNASEQCFVEATRRFDAQLFRESVPRPPHPHSAFFILPSAFTCGFHAISGLQDIGKLVDSVLYVAK